MTKYDLISLVMVVGGLVAVLLGIYLVRVDSGVLGLVLMVGGFVSVISAMLISPAPRQDSLKYESEHTSLKKP